MSTVVEERCTPDSPWPQVWQSAPTSAPFVLQPRPDARPRRSLEPVLRFEIELFMRGQLDPADIPVLLEKLRVCPRRENLAVVATILDLPELDAQVRDMARFTKAHLVAIFREAVRAEDLLWALEFAIQPPQERQMALVELMGRSHDAWGKFAKSDDLRVIVGDAGAPSGARAAALAELVARGRPEVPGIIEASLVDAKANSEWGNALLHAAERVDFEGEVQRTSVLRGLENHASRLTDAADEPGRLALWAALRRYSSMVPATRVGFFSPFLSHRDPPTRQCALQGIANVFSREPPPESAAVAELRMGVSQVMDWALAPPRGPEKLALAAAAFCAAAALAHEALPEMARALHTLNSGFALRRALRDLGDMERAWGTSPGPGPDRLREAMETLRRAP